MLVDSGEGPRSVLFPPLLEGQDYRVTPAPAGARHWNSDGYAALSSGPPSPTPDRLAAPRRAVPVLAWEGHSPV